MMTTRARETPAVCDMLERRVLLASTSTLLQYDFNSAMSWQQTPGQATAGVSADLVHGGVGTIDTEDGTTPSGGLRLTVSAAPATPWTSDLTSGQLAVTNTETNLGKLTLSFSLSASQLKPVKVIVTSYDANGMPTGALATVINPAATYNCQHYALDLSTMTASGSGAFNPVAPKVSFDFEMDSRAGWTVATATQLRLDNVNYAKPAYYVSALTGSDFKNGLTENTAFLTVQKALNVAQPGDIILMMNGTYTVSGGTAKIAFPTGGTPAAWVSLKNYPGQSPLIYSEWWNAILIGRGSSATQSTAAALAYIEVRGLHVMGDSAKVGAKSAPDGPYDSTAPAGSYGVYGPLISAEKIYATPDGRTNGNGISIDGRYELNKPHDIRFADNFVEQCAGGGIGAGEVDRVQIENNVVRDNCYWDIYGTSGISVLSDYNFDGTAGNYTRLVRNNNVSGNQHKEIWKAANKYSDGNGIIIDLNHNATLPNGVTVGRTLVTNNISFNNGGSGIHAFGADHVDIINNVTYLNSASPHQQYGEIFAGSSGTPGSAADINIFNNILVAPVANTGGGEPAEPVTGGLSGSTILYKNNVYFGGNIAANTATWNTGNVTADPKFVLPSIDAAVANFRLQSTSPAINLGLATLAPNLDFAGSVHYAAPDSGVYEFIPAIPAAVALAAASDTGVAGDNKTKLNNASAVSKLSFTVTGTLSGATVNLYAGTTFLGSATANGTTTTVTTNGVAALADGATTITATQTFAGAPSDLSPTLAIFIDTVGPTLVGTPLINGGALMPAGRSQVNTIVWTFSEPVAVGLSNFVLTNQDTGQVVSLSSRSVVVSGNTVTLGLDQYGVDPNPGLFLANGNYQLALSPSVVDAAGNALDANGDGTPGETPVVSFFKLLGDYDGDRQVSFNDFLVLQAGFGATAGNATFNAQVDHSGNGVIDFNDFLTLQAVFGSSVAPASNPSPLTFIAAALPKKVPPSKTTPAPKTTAPSKKPVRRPAQSHSQSFSSRSV